MPEMPRQESSRSTEEWAQPQKGECGDCGEVSELEFSQIRCECGGVFSRTWIVWPRPRDDN